MARIKGKLRGTGPKFSSASPLINSGALLSNVPNDFDDVARPAGRAHDIGAYKKQ
jgi:hypothetical protein